MKRTRRQVGGIVPTSCHRADSGFRHVTPETYKSRMLRVQKISRKVCEVTEVGYYKENFTSDDVFIIDTGVTVYQINGSKCQPKEKQEAAAYLQKLEGERAGKCKGVTYDEDSSDGRKILRGLPSSSKEHKAKTTAAFEKVVFKLSDESGHLEFQEVAKGGAVKRSVFGTDDAFIFDTGNHVYVFIGKGASVGERHKALQYAHNYLMKTDHSLVPITVVSEGKESEEFLAEF